MVVIPFILRDHGEAITEAITELLIPIGLQVPIVLLLTIQFLFSDWGAILLNIFSTGEPDSIHRLIGVTLFLVLVIFLLYNKFSIFLNPATMINEDRGYYCHFCVCTLNFGKLFFKYTPFFNLLTPI
ncbi:hypothetical protein GIB67_021718 [Kingdonia uniflora]|uniref:Uncharacterized protein n=1 Tax=Kingdonia uniflora TaxID=39325 RepID=A0A7J7LMD6_9MAGN|nr:hypothetical protein GIB67_021718 [Kingdonia uniflora]